MALMTKVGMEFIARDRSRTGMASVSRSLKTMSRTMLTMVGVGGGVYALQRGFKAAISAASNMQETQAKFNTVFKNFSDDANQWAEDFGNTVGRSEQSVKSWMARLQDTFVPLGIARDKSMELSKSLVTLAVDVASFNNAADADVIRDFTSALVGNHETVRKYGIIIGESAIKQEALRQGLNKTYKELTDLEKVQMRYNLIQRGTTDAQGDALRTAESYANQIKRLKSNWGDLKVELGERVLPALTEVVQFMNEAMTQHEKLMQRFNTPQSGKPEHPFWGSQSLNNRMSKDALRNMYKKQHVDWWKYGQQFNLMNDWMDQDLTQTGKFTSPTKGAGIFENIIDDTKEVEAKTKYHTDKIEDHWFRAANRSRSEMGTFFDTMFTNINDTDDAFAELGKSIVKSMRMAISDIIAQMVMYNIFTGLGGLTGNAMFTNLATRTGNPYATPVAGNRQAGGHIYKSGLYQMHQGEHVLTPGGAQVIVNNNTGVPMSAGAPAFDGDKIIIDLELAIAERIGRGAGALAPLVNR